MLRSDFSLDTVNLGLQYRSAANPAVVTIYLVDGTKPNQTGNNNFVELDEREANINWSMVICQGSTRSELP